MKRTLITGILLFLFFAFAQGQDLSQAVSDTTPFFRMSLEQLMNVNVTVASQLPMTNRESPGIVTILTQEEIKKSGANDLMEILKKVPGFGFGVDVEGVVGIGVRGNWANEGKVLLLVDGMEMNEDLYSTLQFGGHYPIDRIKRLEIIRGPGSAIYGGNAEYAVINIITSNNSDFNGVYASVLQSMMSRTFGSRNISLAAGNTIGSSHLNVSTSLSEGNRSQENYSDNSGRGYDMSNNSGLSDAQCRVDFSLKGFSLTGMYDAYAIRQRDGYDEVYLRPYKTDFNSGLISLKYDFKASDKFSLTPGIKIKRQEPWSYKKNVNDDTFYPFNTSVGKNEYYINASIDPNEKINISTGVVYYHLTAAERLDSVFFSNGKTEFSLDNYAIFLQSILKLKAFNVILGAREDYNPFYGSSFVPRIGITKVWEKYHLKALYSSAFRTPSIENINASPDILPEKTLIAEIEGGCRLTANSYLTANVFDITTRNPIIYFYDENDEDRYINENSTGTRGFEIDYIWKSHGWYADANYSYYTTQGHTPVSIYVVPENRDKLLAFPSHKLNLNVNVQLSEKININPGVNYLSTRYAFSQAPNEGITTCSFSPAFYSDIAINFENIFCHGFSAQAACINLLDEKVFYIQPYDGNHAPLPGTGREYQIKFKYSFAFKEKK